MTQSVEQKWRASASYPQTECVLVEEERVLIVEDAGVEAITIEDSTGDGQKDAGVAGQARAAPNDDKEETERKRSPTRRAISLQFRRPPFLPRSTPDGRPSSTGMNGQHVNTYHGDAESGHHPPTGQSETKIGRGVGALGEARTTTLRNRMSPLYARRPVRLG